MIIQSEKGGSADQCIPAQIEMDGGKIVRRCLRIGLGAQPVDAVMIMASDHDTIIIISS